MPVLSTLGAAIANVYGFTSGLIKDQYFNLVSLLLPGNGTNGAQNNTFLDSSTNNFTITRNGNTTQGTFSPFSQTGWGNRFGGTVDYITAADSADFDIGSSNFCIECWFWFESRESYSSVIGQWASGQKNFKFGFLTTDALTFTYSTNGTNETDLAQTGTLSTNSWHHIVACRSGTGTNQFAIFIDGSRVHNSTLSATFFNSTAALGIGGDATGACVGGYISNARVVVGSAVYDPTLSTLTVPTSPLTAITNTKLLTCQSNRFIDTNTQVAAKTITVNGSPSVTPFSPFAPTQSYSAAAVGGSGYFDGTLDSLTGPTSNAAFAFGTGAYSVEAWVYLTGFDNGGVNAAFVVDCGGATNAFNMIVNTNGSLALNKYGVGAVITGNSGKIALNSWNHIAICRNSTASNDTRLFVNGALDTTGTDSNDWTVNTTPTFGGAGNLTTLDVIGYLSGIRIIKSQALATSAFTPPTAPVSASTVGWNGSSTAISGTCSLLLNFTNAGVVDATAKNVLETVGNAQISTTQSKWVGGSSISIPKTSTDYLKLNLPVTDLCAFGSGDFVIEFWLRLAAVPGSGQIGIVYDSRPSATNGAYAMLYIDNATLKYYVSSADRITGSALSINTWYYIAVARASGSTRLYIDGTQQGSTYSDSTVYLNGSQRPLIGTSGNSPSSSEAINGFIDDLRVTKGSARGYSGSTITVPIAPFPVQ